MAGNLTPSPSARDGNRLRWPQRLARYAVLQGSRRRALAALSGASVGDFFVPALPTQTSVLALGLLQPRRAAWIALAFASAAALGAALLAALLALVSGYAQQFGTAEFGGAWVAITERARVYGVWAVLVASIFPTPPRLLTAASLIAGVGTFPVVTAVFFGKLIWFGVFLWLLTRAPQLLARIPLLGRSLERFNRFRNEVLTVDAGRG